MLRWIVWTKGHGCKLCESFYVTHTIYILIVWIPSKIPCRPRLPGHEKRGHRSYRRWSMERGLGRSSCHGHRLRRHQLHVVHHASRYARRYVRGLSRYTRSLTFPSFAHQHVPLSWSVCIHKSTHFISVHDVLRMATTGDRRSMPLTNSSSPWTATEEERHVRTKRAKLT